MSVGCFIGHTDEHGGKGKIVFNLRARDLPSSGEHFQVHIRFAIEAAGQIDNASLANVRHATVPVMLVP